MIKAKGIRKIYKNGKIEVEALKGVDLLVKKGEFVSIMGASGSGKSTMMNILGAEYEPLSVDVNLSNT